MRWVDIKNGIKERLNEMLGTSDNAASGNDLTYWSIQSAMLTNLRRIVKSVNGHASSGRVMEGLEISIKNNIQFVIQPGFGFTTDGDIIVLEKELTINISPFTASTSLFILLKHENAQITDTEKGGRYSNILGKSSQWIVNDDRGAAEGSSITSAIVEQTETVDETDGDYVTLGTVEISSGSVATVVQSSHRGLAPNRSNGEYLVPEIRTVGNAYVEGILYATAIEHESPTGEIDINSIIAFKEDVSFEDAVDLSACDDLKLPSRATGAISVGGVDVAADAVETSVDTFNITIKNGLITTFTKLT